MPKIPEAYRVSTKAYILSQLIGVLTETAFVDFSSTQLLTHQFRIYERGFFPCGWSVGSPDSFPEKAVIMVF
jgi:hypothetical protein